MIATLKKLSKSTFYFKAFEWTKLITIVGGAQVIVQIVGMISGIIIIRHLSVQEYALYTLANTALGTLTILSDGGISTGVMAQGSKAWRDKVQLGKVVVTGLDLRKKFATFGLLLFFPVVAYFLVQHGASYLTAVLILLSVIPSFFASLSDSLLQVAPKLNQDIKPLQKNSIVANIGRLALIASTVTFFPLAFIAIIGAGIPRMIANVQLRKIAGNYVDWTQKSNETERKNILKTVKRLLPEQLYFCISSQITIWLVSIFGSTQSIAHIGVLSRLSMLLTIFGMIFQYLVVPRFARLPNTKNSLYKWFYSVQFLLLTFFFLVVMAAKLFTVELLSIIGPQYSGLDNVFILAVITAMLASFTGILYSLMISRSFIMHPAISISIGIIIQVILISLLNFSRLEDVYYFSIAQSIVGVLSANIYFLLRMRQKKKEEAAHL